VQQSSRGVVVRPRDVVLMTWTEGLRTFTAEEITGMLQQIPSS
jgi:hypothetical protein